MTQALECRYYFDSTAAAGRASGCGASRDLAADPAAAEELAELGVPREDLPAVLLSEPEGGNPRVLGFRLTPEEASLLAAGHTMPGDRLTVYISEWCPDCRRAKRVLEEAAVPFDEIDIDRDAGAEALVVSRSGGKRIVPTLRFEERIWAFNPEPALLRKLLGKAAKTEH